MEDEARTIIERLFRSEYQHLLYCANQMLCDPHRAEDAVQETFREALLAGESLCRHPNPSAWLLRVLKCNVYDSVREYQKNLRYFLSMEELIGAAEQSTEQVGLPGVAEILRRVEEYLPPEDVLLLKRAVLYGESRAETAQALGISVGACQKRLERIRKRLRPYFPEYFED